MENNDSALSTDIKSLPIITYYQNNQETWRKKEKKRTLLTALRSMLWNYFGYNFQLIAVGSSATELGHKNSDFDLCLLISSSVSKTSTKTQDEEVLKIVGDIISRCKHFSKIIYIPSKVPIIRFLDHLSGIRVDMNINNRTGISNTLLLSLYGRLDKRFKPLTFFIKRWATLYHINSSVDNTLSSYALTLMTIYYLQDGVEPNVLPIIQQNFQNIFKIEKFYLEDQCASIPGEIFNFKSLNKQTLFELFKGFLNFYAEFDFENLKISVRLGKTIEREQNGGKAQTKERKFICIEEPFNENDNVSRAVFEEKGFNKIKVAFKTSAYFINKSDDMSYLLKHI